MSALLAFTAESLATAHASDAWSVEKTMQNFQHNSKNDTQNLTPHRLRESADVAIQRGTI
jgi:hypothetical protein